MIKYSLLFLISVTFLSCLSYNPPKKKDLGLSLPLDSLVLPEGFAIEVYADSVTNARSMALSPSGTLFVSTRNEGNVYALQDLNGNYQADTMFTILSEGNLPNGVAFKDGDLYVAEVNRILKFSDIESKLSNPGEPEVIYDEYPTEKHHGWKYIAFGPDDKLYVPVGAPCNICESADKVFNTITRMNADGSGFEIVQEGVRNTVGFTWHPETSELWFTDNGRDRLSDDEPACELNRATADYQHFGYPYCHQGDLPDPEFGEKRACAEFVAPSQNLGPHVAPLGCEFVKGQMFPQSFGNKILIAEHGSWNRSSKIGYRLTMVELDENHNATNYEDFISGWLNEEEDDVWGRPVDLEWLPDGSLLVTDDFADVIYRVSYKG